MQKYNKYEYKTTFPKKNYHDHYFLSIRSLHHIDTSFYRNVCPFGTRYFAQNGIFFRIF